MSPKKANTKATGTGEVGRSKAQDSESDMAERNEGSEEVLNAIASLHMELTKMRLDICDTLRNEIAALKAENDAAIPALEEQLRSQHEKIEGVTASTSATADTVNELDGKS